jgi:hypothetical protein
MNQVEIVTKPVAKIEQKKCQQERKNERQAFRKRSYYLGPVRFLQTRPVPEDVEKYSNNGAQMEVKSIRNQC